VRVFEGLLFDVAEAQLPPGAERALDGPAGQGVYRAESPGLAGRMLGSATFWLPPVLVVFWIWNARRARRRGRGWKRAWLGGLTVALVVYLIVLATATVVYAAF
jgi:hypothetical protein